MPGVIIHSQADTIVSWEVNRVMAEVIKGIAGENFFSYEYNHSGPGHWGDYVYFDGRLPVSAYDGIDFLLENL